MNHVYTHKYTGPDTRDGLKQGTKCVIVGRQSGGRNIRTHGGKKQWLVGANHVEKI